MAKRLMMKVGCGGPDSEGRVRLDLSEDHLDILEAVFREYG